MELALSILPLLCTTLHFNFSEMILKVMKYIIRGFFFLIGLVVIPVAKLRSLGKRRRCPAIENPILLQSARELSRRIHQKEITSEEVVLTYINRCKEVNPILNAIVENRFEKAIAEARAVDELLKKLSLKDIEELVQQKPLLGLPVTVKQSIGLKGMNHCVGVKMEKPLMANEDADVVRRIRDAGGILLLTSNTPELCMWWETHNKVNGVTWNPYDTRRTAGGSSGGEAALLGAGASLLSLASDIAGSARLPAMFCGVFGHKPSPGWVSHVGHRPDCPDERWSSFFTIGAMARYAEDLLPLLRVMCQEDEPRRSLDTKVSLENMKFYYLENDGGSGVTRSLDRDIKSAIRKLIGHLKCKRGVEVKKANLPDLKYSFEMASTVLLALEDVECIFNKEDNPREWKSVFVEVLKYLFFVSPHTFPNVTYGILKKTHKALPRSYVSKMTEKRASLRKQFQDLLGDNGVLIYPSFTTSAHYPHEIMYKICDASYLMVFNALGLPVTQCPIGFDKHKLPIGVQIVANPGHDRLTIAVAQEIQKVFGGWREPCNDERTV